MNERIRELAEQAGFCHDINNSIYLCAPMHMEKFAELIVGECGKIIAHDTANWPGDEGQMAYYQGVQDAVKSIRNHFGVEL